MPAPTSLEVFLDHPAGPVLAGMAYFTARRGEVTTRFEYETEFLAQSDAFDFSPTLRLRDKQATTAGLAGAFADSAPDRWGRNLIRRRIQAAARQENATAPIITEVDYLCGVSDLTRQGALRFRSRTSTAFLADGVDVPRMVDLPTLLAASREVATDANNVAAVKTLLAAGSASLGGARPKASVNHGGVLAIAKFPHPGDEWDIMAWEATVLDLAGMCGIATPVHRLVSVGDSSVLVTERFDRQGASRVPYISAMTLLNRSDGDPADYMELAEELTSHGARVRQDLRQLWRRIAFTLAVNNTDDHLRNHGFLRVPGGWALAPLFDVNPDPESAAHRATAIMGATQRGESLEELFATAEAFELQTSEADDVWSEVRAGVAQWRRVANANGLSVGQQERFADVLDSPEFGSRKR